MKKITALLTILLLTAFGFSIFAQPQPTLPRINLEEYVTGFDAITDISHTGIDARMFVVEQDGQVWIVDGNGNTLNTPFLDISNLLATDHFERGLLGLVFDPDYANNGYFYVNYTAAPNGETHISRFQVTADPNIADPASEVIILTQSQPFGNHNAGDLYFGPDSYLYIPLGDGGSGGDPFDNAQDGSTFLGKMLRIDVSTLPYTIPADNPFVGDPNVLDEIWAMGLRNPYRFSFDRMTGDMWISDAGQNMWEEINFEPANSGGGFNWGWDCYEGNHIFEPAGCGPASDYDFPIFEYDHNEGCVVIGGFVYRGSDYPVMQGHYILADWCSGKFWTVYPDGNGGWAHTDQLSFNQFDYTTFGEDMNGELYVGGGSGDIYRITDISCQNNKIQICHNKGKNPRTLCIAFDEEAIQDHLDHGDELGPCDNSSNKWAAHITEQRIHISVAPNPASNTATLELASSSDDQISIDIYDIKGSIVLELYYGRIESGNHYFFDINSAELTGGIYIIKVRGEQLEENYKLIINH